MSPGHDREQPLDHEPGGTVGHSDRPFHHYSVEDFRFAVTDLPWQLEPIRAWAHPRGQSMMAFART